jgi:outer membrane protein OmpA-like peptidoglycan-associated protein
VSARSDTDRDDRRRRDRCPNDPESYNALDDEDGCPDRGRVIVSDSMIMVLEPVHFQHDRDAIAPRSFPILDAVAETLLGNVDIQLIEIQGHTDERGNDADNLALSDRRAVRLPRREATQRLVPQGYGETQPIDRRHDAQAWTKRIVASIS